MVGLNIADPRAVADALRRALQRATIGSIRRAALVVPDGIARVSLLRFEQVPPRAIELDQLIKWQLRKATPFPLDEAQVSHVLANTQDGASTFAAVVARRDVIAQYEAVAAAVGAHAGIVDLASFNVINALLGADPSPLRAPQGRLDQSREATGSESSRAASRGDWLLICMAHEGTTIAILRGAQLMFYRHRAAIDEEPLSALVHQTAMYHEDRLGGATFARVWLCGAALADAAAGRARREISDRLGVAAETVDVRPAASLRDRAAAAADVLDALAAPVGVLLRERVA
jgi:Tfp pilus assembly PilM family ATPase